MAKTEFKKRLRAAVAKLIEDKRLLDVWSNALYTPMRIDGAWKWMAFSEPDGLFAQKINVAKGDPAKVDEESEVIACVMVQSEESTSDSLLNPWGKACIPSIPGGVWIDYKDGTTRKRRHLTVAHVIMVTPEPKSQATKTQANFKRRKGVLERVDEAAAGMTLVVAGKNEGRDSLAAAIWAKAKEHLA